MSEKETNSKNKSPEDLNGENPIEIIEEKLKDENQINEKSPQVKKDSLFNRVLENGFDGITTNPNYKLLALLIILLINLSLFFFIGNLGKAFLRDSGILS